MIWNNIKNIGCFVAIITLWVGCSKNIDSLSGEGGNSQQGNAIVFGTINKSDGEKEKNATIKFIPIPTDSIVIENGVPDSLITQSDSLGDYLIKSLPIGEYNIFISSQDDKTGYVSYGQYFEVDSSYNLNFESVKTTNIFVEVDTTTVNSSGVVVVQGLDFVIPVNEMIESTNYVEISGIPINTPYQIKYADKISNDTILIVKDYIPVDSIPNITSQSGTWLGNSGYQFNIPDSTVKDLITNVPVLLRLKEKNIDFNLSKIDGSDLRIFDGLNRPVIFDIDTWDNTNKEATIWLLLDSIKPIDTTFIFNLRWGNEGAKSQPLNKVFNDLNRYAGVWHMNSRMIKGEAKIEDVSGNDNHLNIIGNPEIKSGLMGSAIQLDGVDDYLHLNNLFRGDFTISFWARGDSLNQPSFSGLFSSDTLSNDSTFQIDLKTGNGSYRLNIFTNEDDMEFGKMDTSYQFISMTYNSNEIKMYFNGVFVQSFVPNKKITFSQFAVGVNRVRSQLFFGKIDELRIYRESMSDDWIRFSYLIQK